MSDRDSRGEHDPTYIASGPEGPTGIELAMSEHLEWLQNRNYSNRTTHARRNHFRAFAAWLAEQGIAETTQLTPAVMERYRRRLHEPATPGGRLRAMNTQYAHIVSLRLLFRFLRVTGRIQSDPLAALELPRLEAALPTSALSLDEVELVLAQPDVTTPLGIRDRAIMETLFATGIRRRELAHITIEDIDRRAMTVAVRRGKGRRGRLVPISDRALRWVDRYLVEARPWFTCTADEGTLFVTRRGETLGLVMLGRRIAEYLAAAGLHKVGSCHVFRATTATMMLEAGADIRYIQEMLGHSSIVSTQRYARVSIGSLQRVYGRTHPSAGAGAASLDHRSDPDDQRIVAVAAR
jgi:integrase/recombinase XerD